MYSYVRLVFFLFAYETFTPPEKAIYLSDIYFSAVYTPAFPHIDATTTITTILSGGVYGGYNVRQIFARIAYLQPTYMLRSTDRAGYQYFITTLAHLAYTISSAIKYLYAAKLFRSSYWKIIEPCFVPTQTK